MDMVCEDSAMEVFLAFPEKGEALTNDVMEEIVTALPSLNQADPATPSANREVDLAMDSSGIDGALPTP